MTRYHLEGMGVVGCLVATMLEGHNIDFTWNDINADKTAWKASTGCVFPTGNDMDTTALMHWQRYLQPNSCYFANWLENFVEYGRWSYVSETPPHGGSDKAVIPMKRVENIKLSSAKSIHLNVQAFVQATRKRFKDKRKKPNKKRQVIVTHGTASASRFVWGWSGQASIDIGDDLLDALDELGGERPCLYVRERYQMSYIYPLPGTRRYYIGTSTINMKTQKEKPVKPELKKFRERIESNLGRHVSIRGVHKGTLKQGWRPAVSEDTPYVKETNGQILLRPMAGNGIRHFPILWSALHELVDCEVCKPKSIERRY